MSEAQWEEAKVDILLEHVLPVLASSLYGSDPRCAIRELALQNPTDACLERSAQEGGLAPEIHVWIDRQAKPNGALIIRDQGIGMTRKEVVDNLARIGGTSKRDIEAIKRAAADDRQRQLIEERIGRFGMGFLAGFIIGERITVRTLRHGQPAEAGVEAEFGGQASFKYRTTTIPAAGTEVTIYLKPEYGASATEPDKNLLDTDHLTKILRDYGDLLRYPVFVHRDMHDASGKCVTTNNPPWLHEGTLHGFLQFYKHRFPGTNEPLVVFPVNIRKTISLGQGETRDLVAGGLLYIPNPPAKQKQEYGVIELYVKRMYVCQDRDKLLPEWATLFVNGLIDTSSLTETLDRNDVVRTDRMYVELRLELSRLLVEALLQLEERRSQDFENLMTVHGDRIRHAALQDQAAFFKAIAPSLPVTVFSREFIYPGKRLSFRRYLDQVAAVAPTKDSKGRKVISYFSHHSRDMIQNLAAQHSLAVIDATAPDNRDFLLMFSATYPGQYELQDVSQSLAEYVKDVSATEAQKWQQFVNYYEQGLGPREGVKAAVKDFKPFELPAVLLLVAKDDNAEQQLQVVLNSAAGQLPAVSRALTEELQRQRASVGEYRLFLNASNPLMRDLRTYAEEHGRGVLPDEVQTALHEIYHNAKVHAGEPQTPDGNLHIFEWHNKVIASFLNVLRGLKRSEEVQRELKVKHDELARDLAQSRQDSEEKVQELEARIKRANGLLRENSLDTF